MKIIKVYKSLSAFLFYITLIIIVAGINFSDNKSPGWFIQPLPVNDEYLDLFFIDSLRGWMVSNGNQSTSDTGYIIHSYNGGYNWVVQLAEPQLFKRVQFLDTNYGYVVGGYPSPCIKKTTNGGLNWLDISSNIGNLFTINDISFVNKDTGWVCINDFFDGGIYKTVNGGGNWTQQKYDPSTYGICFINKDTGWYFTNVSNAKIWQTTNGGVNWNNIYTGVSTTILHMYFFNGTKGWIQSGGSGGNGIKYTTNGGYNWNISSGPLPTGYNIKFFNESTGYAGNYTYTISKSTDGGITWGYQNTPIQSQDLISILRNDTLKAWSYMLMHTSDGGGPIVFSGVQQISSNVPEDYKLFQNYPNPFNPSTNIKLQILKTENRKWKKENGIILLKVFDLAGKEIETLINEKLGPGTYEVKFNAGKLSSGIYFYSLFADNIRIDTKKAVLIK